MENWDELNHAFGSAGDIPALLADLAFFPAESSYEAEPWFSLWSSLCHQGDIYSASFAAVPEIVKHLANNPLNMKQIKLLVRTRLRRATHLWHLMENNL